MQFIPCSHRYPRTSAVELVVIHTNEGPEGPNSAEGLANYLARPDVIPGYHFVVDENSIVQCANLNERVNGAGGVNDKSVHVCITGYAAQSAAQWGDPSSLAALALAEDIARSSAAALSVPWQRIYDPRTEWGVCGHADVSRYYTASAGHYDPGPNFPWADFIAGSVDDMFTDEDRARLKAVELLAIASAQRLDDIEDDVKNVRAAVRDSSGSSIPARTWRRLKQQFGWE